MPSYSNGRGFVCFADRKYLKLTLNKYYNLIQKRIAVIMIHTQKINNYYLDCGYLASNCLNCTCSFLLSFSCIEDELTMCLL